MTVATAARRPLSVGATIAAYVAVFFVTLPMLLWAVGGRLDVLLALPRVPQPIGQSTGTLALAAGTAWMLWSMEVLWRRGDGLPISHLPPRNLVSQGPYRVMRHPIYVGYTVAFAGAGLSVGSLGRGIGATILLGLGCVNYVLAIEGPQLARRHGRRYAQYRAAMGAVSIRRGLGRAIASGWALVRGPLEWLANHTILFRVGPTIWVTFGAFVGAGATLCGSLTAATLLRDGLTVRQTEMILAGMAVAMSVGAHLLWLMTAAARRLQLPWRLLLRRVGFVSWGAYAGFFGLVALAARLTQHDTLWLVDRMIGPALVCSVLGRVGCLTYGCCYGRPSPGGLLWTCPDAKVVREAGGRPPERRLPTQLLSALATAAVVFFIAGLTLRPSPEGTVTGLALLAYGLLRFGIDSLRDRRNMLRDSGIDRGQLGSLGAIAAGLLLTLTVHGASSWPRPATDLSPAMLLPVWPVIALVSVLVFVVASFHWKRIGHW